MPLGSLNPHSPQTHVIAALFTSMLILCAVIFLIVAGLVAYSVVRYRARAGALSGVTEPERNFGSRSIEITWTVIPLVLVTGIFIATVHAVALIDAPTRPARPPDLM